MNNLDTIAAKATAQGQSAIAVIRVSGAKAIAAVDSIGKNRIAQLKANQIKFRRLYDGDQIIEEAMVAVFKAPNSFTGEDTVEIYLHGSDFIAQKVLKLLINQGVRLAEPGEFTMRAYFNGKMDLSQAEAVADLIAAETESEHLLALSQLHGGISRQMNALRTKMLEFAALIELELDFGEEDVEFADRAKLAEILQLLKNDVDDLLQSFKVGNAIKDGVPVAIIGKPNAGKSTLLNAILGEERAIVTEIAGTTRDTIEETRIIDTVRFRFIDTAGIRHTGDAVEVLGVERAKQSIQKARIVLCVYDAVNTTPEEIEELKALTEGLPKETIWFVANKTDLARGMQVEGYKNVEITARNGEISTLYEEFNAYAREMVIGASDSTISNVRHFAVLQATQQAIQLSMDALQSGISGDRLAHHIREAMTEAGKITGEIDSDEVLGEIFGKFCIGK